MFLLTLYLLQSRGILFRGICLGSFHILHIVSPLIVNLGLLETYSVSRLIDR